MKKQLLTGLMTSCLLILAITKTTASHPENFPSRDTSKVSGNEKLVVLWTSGDREVALKMVFMYTFNARKFGWWEDITLLVWGPSQKLLTEDKELQGYVKKMIEDGIEVLACKGCADQYAIAEKLIDIGVTVRYTGKDLTEFIKNRYLITF